MAQVSGLRLLRWLAPLLCLTLTAQVSSARTPDARDAHETRALTAQVSSAQTPDARDAHETRETAHRAGDVRPDARPDAQPPVTPQPATERSPSSETPSPDWRVPEPAADSSAFVQGQDSGPFMTPAPRRRARTRAQARLAGLAVMAARVANQANLAAAGTFEAPRGMGSSSERRVLLRRPEPIPPAIEPDVASPPASMGVLDESIVKEISQRKTMFRMCYESARRRSVMVSRADVRWILSPDGSVRDVVVEVAQDEILARCIRVIASRPFPATLPQEIPVTIPLLFVSER